MRLLVDAPDPLDILDEVKEHVAVESDEFDTLLEAYIATAVAQIEKETGRAIMPQTWAVMYPCWRDVFILPLPPATAVNSIKYRDDSNVEQTLNSSNYRFVQTSHVSYVEIDHNASLPSLYDRIDAIKIEFDCGYETVPDLVTHAVKLLCGAWFAWREGEVDRTTNDLQLGVSRLLSNLKVGTYI